MRVEDKLTVLADAAKYDASCASSGSRRHSSAGIRSFICAVYRAAIGDICRKYSGTRLEWRRSRSRPVVRPLESANRA